MEILLVVLLSIAVYRLTRVITRDKLPLIDIPRNAFVLRWGAYDGIGREKDDVRRNWLVRAFRWFWASEFPAIAEGRKTNLVMKSLAYLWECDWCMSVWVGAGVVYAATFYTAVPYPVLTWLTTAAVTGLLTQWEAVLDKKAE